MSTPRSAQEGGALFGAVLGYELSNAFAIELAYACYPKATVYYDPNSLFSFEHDGLSQFSTETDTFSLMAKFMVYLANTSIRLFSSAGPAYLHRVDMMVDRWLVTPVFALGINYDFTPHIMGEFAFTYTSGYGESELDPAFDYMPFLYGGLVTLVYKF